MKIRLQRGERVAEFEGDVTELFDSITGIGVAVGQALLQMGLLPVPQPPPSVPPAPLVRLVEPEAK